MKPHRVQRHRTRGYRLPPNTKSVTRPHKWGNPWQPGKPGPMGRTPIDAEGAVYFFSEMFRDEEMRLAAGYPSVDDIRRELRGFNLACYCPADQKHCHADVLLRVANEGATR